MKRLIPGVVIALGLGFGPFASAQKSAQPARLFRDQAELPVRVAIPLKEIKRSLNDTVYFPTTLHFESEGRWDSLQVGVRARGNFRRKHCYFPPLRIRIKKSQAKGTLFAGARHLKLVIPCQTAKNYVELIHKEYLCYQLCEVVSPYAFETRKVSLTLHDTGGREKSYELAGFMIEDDDDLAERMDAVVADEEKIHPLNLQDTAALRLDLFQYMIANSDYSTTFLHNAKLLQTKSNARIPIGYDFDMAGLVNAPYATFDESLGIKSVHERVYKGFCRNEAVAQYVRQEFIDAKPRVLSVLEENAALFDDKEFAGIKKYLNAFFEVLENDEYYKVNITQKCRTE